MVLKRKHIMRTTPGLSDMDQSAQDFAQNIAQQTSLQAIWDMTCNTARNHGMDYLIYMYLRPTAPQDNALVLANMPDWWGDYYLEDNLAARDPFFKTCQSFELRCTGREFLPDNARMLSGGEQQFIHEAGETGLISGFASPVRLANPGHFGGWNFGSSMQRNEFRSAFETQAQRLQLMGFFAHEHLQNELNRTTKMAGTGHPEDPARSEPVLSDREKECLLWLARGLRTSQIGDHLGLATVTIDLHFKRARQKLGAATREEALAKAIISGQIQP